MKNSLKLAMLLLFSVTLLTTGCSSDDEGPNIDNTARIQEIVTIAESGSWTITYYYDTDQEETSNYNGYQFLFNNDGTITATSTIGNVTGTWSVSDDSNSSDRSSSDSDIDFNIAFTSPPDFEELSDDWDIVSATANKIELIDISGGNGGTDYLTFEKQ